MIGLLSGQLLHKKAPFLVLSVQGVGYELQAPMNTFYDLPATGKDVTLYTHLVVREDNWQLFGFCTERERELFRLLIKANGIGPKVALSMLSAMPVETLVSCMQSSDTSLLTRIPGIGKKTAERLLVEIREPLKKWLTQLDQPISTDPLSTLQEDAISALMSLGYKDAAAKKAIAAVKEQADDVESLIRLALQGMTA